MKIFFQTISGQYSIPIPPENVRKSLFFWRLQGVLEWKISLKGVNVPHTIEIKNLCYDSGEANRNQNVVFVLLIEYVKKKRDVLTHLRLYFCKFYYHVSEIK